MHNITNVKSSANKGQRSETQFLTPERDSAQRNQCVSGQKMCGHRAGQNACAPKLRIPPPWEEIKLRVLEQGLLKISGPKGTASNMRLEKTT